MQQTVEPKGINMKVLAILMLMISCVHLTSGMSAAEISKQNDGVKKQFMNTFPEQNQMLSELFEALDPKIMGDTFRKALDSGNREQLIKSTAKYFRSRTPRTYCKHLNRSIYTRKNADRAVRGDVTVINIPYSFPNGKINWFFNPTLTKPPVNHEWLWQLNRMYFWMDMAVAYEKTKNEKYAKAFNDQLYSWIATAGTPGDKWNAPGSVWRTIEAGLRMMRSWCLGFETFRNSPSFTDENLCLMLSSMYRHGLHLQANHKQRKNWLLMEMSGLYTFAALFPEFKCSSTMRTYAAETFSKAIMSQILPDGMHDELSPDYHGVMLRCSLAFYNIAKLEGIKSELPPEFINKLELSFESVLNMATPSLTSPRTNDCFTSHVPSRMKNALEIFPHRQDFLWGSTRRRKGNKPSSTPSASRFFPWAGFAVMRSSWDADAAYCCFDVGPLGAGHAHQDKLNIQIYKGSQELIYDDGGGQYEKSIYRSYGVNASAHNTVLVDGLLQRRTAPEKVDSPIDANWISNEKFDYAKGVYDDVFGPLCFNEADAKIPLTTPAKHTREVRFYKPDFFCVMDTLNSADGKTHSYEMRLQLDTLKLEPVSAIPGAYLSDYGKTYDILIIPLFPDEVETRLLSGDNTPPMGGWFVGRNDLKLHQSTTLTMTVSGKKDCRFATLLIPIKRGEKLPEIDKQSASCFILRFKKRKYFIDLDNLSR